MANAVISAIENLRDDEEETDLEFRIALQDNYSLTLADEYLDCMRGMCICPPDYQH
jgi:hypothetical protein